MCQIGVRRRFLVPSPHGPQSPVYQKNERKSHTAKTRTMALDNKFAIDMNVIELETQEKSKSRPCL
jgi:hypothetical protein